MMEFINNKNFKHTFYKDATRINYTENMLPNLINDYGYSYLMLRYGRIDACNFKNKTVTVPKVFVKGTGDYFTVTAFKDSSWLSFELPNHILHNITKIHAVKNRNKLISLCNYVEEDIVKALYNELADIHHIEEMTKVVDYYLGSYYQQWSEILPSTEIVNYIVKKKGKLTVDSLREKFPYSQKTIERMFSKEVGASPYRFICLVRFNYVIRELQKSNHLPVQELIYDYNYFDHSHFEKDFKKFLGQSIKAYKNIYNPLLTNGLDRIYKR
ncbi:helix-turn-helix domain-containing protein [Wenyingzhuangia sp. IMCC45533]